MYIRGDFGGSGQMKVYRIIAFLLLMLITLTPLNSCVRIISDNPAPIENPYITPKEPGASAIVPPVETEGLIEAFGFNELMDEILANESTNAAISPLSYKFALSMAYNGATGDTAELISDLLASPQHRDKNALEPLIAADDVNAWTEAYVEWANKYKEILPEAPPEDYLFEQEASAHQTDFRIANSYWVRDGMETALLHEFVDALAVFYNAESGSFDNDPAPINQWVSEATNGKINEIISEIGYNTLSYLINALYFKAQWESVFNVINTRLGEFTNTDGTIVEVEMLNGQADGYINTDAYEGITKRLQDGFLFTAVMPKTEAPVTLDSIIEALGTADSRFSSIFLTLPKFDIETTVKSSRGVMPDFDALFEPSGLDGALSYDAKLDGLSLFISEIIQKTTFTLEENGIEASAVTVVSLNKVTAVEPSEIKAVIFDKPFYFTLTDKDKDVLFIGKVVVLETQEVDSDA
jgi:serpin B